MSEIEKLLQMMPTAKPADAAGGASRPADMTVIVGLQSKSDKHGWQALKETVATHGAEAEAYWITTLGDRHLIEIWFSGGRSRATIEWALRLEELERRG